MELDKWKIKELIFDSDVQRSSTDRSSYDIGYGIIWMLLLSWGKKMKMKQNLGNIYE